MASATGNQDGEAVSIDDMLNNLPMLNLHKRSSMKRGKKKGSLRAVGRVAQLATHSPGQSPSTRDPIAEAFPEHADTSTGSAAGAEGEAKFGFGVGTPVPNDEHFGGFDSDSDSDDGNYDEYDPSQPWMENYSVNKEVRHTSNATPSNATPRNHPQISTLQPSLHVQLGTRVCEGESETPAHTS